MIERAMMERAFYGPHFPARNSNFEGVSEEKRALGDVASKTATKSKVRREGEAKSLEQKRNPLCFCGAHLLFRKVRSCRTELGEL